MREKLLSWTSVVLVSSFLLPNHYSPWLSFHQELAAALAFFPLLLYSCLRKARVPPLAYGAALLATVPLLQGATGQLYFSTDGWMATLYLLGFALSVHAGAQMYDPVTHSNSSGLSALSALWVALLLAALLSVGLAAHQWLIPSYQGIYVTEIPPHARPFGNLAQPNQLATLLLLGVAGLIFLWESGRIGVVIACLTTVMLIGGLVMTGSRSVLLALLWLVPAYWIMRHRCHLKTKPVFVFFSITLYLLMAWMWPVISQSLLVSEQSTTVIDRLGSAGIRKIYWTSMLDAISRSPLVGYGWGQISIAQTSIALDYPPTYSNFDSAHNLFIDLALWNGIPVALLTSVGLVAWFYRRLRKCQDPQALAILMGIGAVFSHAMVEYPLNYAYFLLPVGLLMGSLSPVLSTAPLEKTALLFRNNATYRGTVTVGIATIILLSMVIIEYLPFEADWQLMRFQEARIGNSDKTPTPPAILLKSLSAFAEFSRTEARPAMSDEEIEKMRHVSERFPYASSMYKYALALALNEKPQDATKVMQKICKIHNAQACASAKKNWEELTKAKYPQLAIISFTAIFPNDDRTYAR